MAHAEPSDPFAVAANDPPRDVPIRPMCDT
jgi:hypothetical protein